MSLSTGEAGDRDVESDGGINGDVLAEFGGIMCRENTANALDVARALGAAGWPKVEDGGTAFIGRSGQYGILVYGSVLDAWNEIEEVAEGACQIFDHSRDVATWTRRMVSPERAEELLGKYGESFYKSDQSMEMVPEYEENRD